jgi:hypothetical protein
MDCFTANEIVFKVVGENLRFFNNCKSCRYLNLMLRVMSVEITPVRFLFGNSLLSLRIFKNYGGSVEN